MRFIRKNKNKVLYEDVAPKGTIISCFDYCSRQVKQRLFNFLDGHKKSISFSFKDGTIVIVEREEWE